MIKNMLRSSRKEEAQGVVEFALISVILMFLFLGTVDFARFMYYDTAIRNAARVGAEAASNQCTNQVNCGTYAPASLNDGIMQSTECESNNDVRVVLQPQISCSICVSTLTGCTNGDPCATGCSSTWCEQDICLVRYKPTCAVISNCDACKSGQGTIDSTSDITSDQCVSVTVGYNFKPITPLMNQFFSNYACWSGDTTPHTLCATSKGRVY